MPADSACPAETFARHRDDDVKTFVAAIAVVLRETVGGFEDTVARITEITVMRPGRADRDLVVALQDFDRLQQEFATLSDVLAGLSGGKEAGPGGDLPMLLAGISIAGLKDRLAYHLRSLTADTPVDDADEAEF